MSHPHVLYITPMFGYPAFGGPRLRTYNTVCALARVADVSLYLTDQPDVADREAARSHLLTFCRDVYFPPVPARPSVFKRAAWRLLPSLAQRLETPREGRDPAVVASLKDWITANHPDLIWLGFGGISYDLIPLRHHAHTKIVLETECVWSRFILRELPYVSDPLQKGKILREGRAKEEEERRGAGHVDITTAASEVDAEYFRSISPNPETVHIVANVIDVESYAKDAGRASLQQPALLFAGTFSAGTANVDAALWLLDEVMPAVWRHRPDAHVYLVGRSPAPPILARQSNRVHVSGEVASIAPYMRASAMALVPLRWESGTRFKILEAFACRTPVISTALGAEGLAVEHERHLMLADEPADFARAILTLLEDPTVGARLVEPAYELVAREYDVSSAARQIEAVLSKLGFGVTVTA